MIKPKLTVINCLIAHSKFTAMQVEYHSISKRLFKGDKSPKTQGC